MHTLLLWARGKPVVRFVHVACANRSFVITFPASFPLRMFQLFGRVMIMSLWRKKLTSACTICKRNTKNLCITCEKSVCVKVECSFAEENEDTFRWNKIKPRLLPAVSWSCSRCWAKRILQRKPSPIQLHWTSCFGNDSLDNECSDNIQPVFELACETGSGED